MKLRNPIDRLDLSIKNNYRVLEVGGGHNPHPRANVVVDKFTDSNYHRSGDIKVLKNQEFLCADGENLPFDNNSFDYVVCCQVIEHVDDPIKFVKEQSRIAPRGYIETPSLIGEYLIPKESHRWVILEIDNKIVMYEKEKIDFKSNNDFGYVFLEYLPKVSIGYKVLQRTHFNIISINYEWKDNIEILVNPDSSYYSDFFTKPWDHEVCNNLLKNKNLSKEFIWSMNAFIDVCKKAFKSKVLRYQKL
ncbi:class I SAM-dependent methyltransferase [Rubrolithibacter danxiaensis]|uniref:class I SAM-dependent methyltransferase n=1 Tax=Rubrolithibacter danxiaensis TaxID=3390805 RepID=UPI003BF77261